MTNYAVRVSPQIAALDGAGVTVSEVSTSSLAAAKAAYIAAQTSPFPLTEIGAAGHGAPAHLKRVEGIITTGSSDAATSLYRVVRLPSTAVIKKILVTSAAQSAGAADLNVAWSDNPNELPQGETLGSIIQINGADNKLFGAAQTIYGITRTDFTFAGTFVSSHLQMPLWAVLGASGGLTVPRSWTDDPGGQFDLLFNVTTAITTGGALFVEVDFTL